MLISFLILHTLSNEKSTKKIIKNQKENIFNKKDLKKLRSEIKFLKEKNT